MMVEKGTATSLRDMGEKFLKFAQKSNDTTQAWKLVDDRLHSFYGATLQVPITKEVTRYVDEEYTYTEDGYIYPKYEIKDNFTGYSEIGLHVISSKNNFSYTGCKLVNNFDTVGSAPEGYTIPTFTNNIDVLSIGTKYTGDTDTIIKYINSHYTNSSNILIIPILPDKNETSYSPMMLNGDSIWQELLSKLSNITATNVINMNTEIKTKNPILSYRGYEDYSVQSNYYTTWLCMNGSSFNAIHKKAIDYALKKNNLSTDNVTYSDYSLFLVDVIYTDDCMKELQSLVDKKLEEIHKVQAKSYPKKVTVTKKGVRKVAKKFSETLPYFYISLQHTDINKNTYADWVRKEVDYPFYRAKYFSDIDSEGIRHKTNQAELYNHNDLEILSYNRRRGRYIRTKYNSDNRENPFIDTGEFLAIGAHTLFDENLWMCEQPQITCEKEAYAQFNRQNLLLARIYNDHGNSDTSIQLPSFPSVGCPWFTMSDENKQEYGTALTYWFTKNDYNATITYRVTRPSDSQDVYQSMSFGMMDCVDDATYKFPLFVAGGSGALTQDIWVFRRTTGGMPTYTQGNSYTLDIKNIALSNSNLLYPCKFNGSNVSNFRILSPEGIWKDIYDMQQDATVVHYFSCGSIWNWGYPLNEPKWLETANLHGAYPCRSDTTFTTDTYRIKEPTNKLKFASPFTRIIVYQTDAIEHKENGIYGILPSNYMSWSKTMPSGEVTISGKKYLSVPNGWDGRLRHYPTEVGVVVNDKWQNKTALASFDTPLSHNKFDNKMLIPLEEGA